MKAAQNASKRVLWGRVNPKRTFGEVLHGVVAMGQPLAGLGRGYGAFGMRVDDA